MLPVLLSSTSPPPPDRAATNTDLARLVVDSSRGSETAFTQLYSRSAGVARAVALQVVGATELADDIVQETYVDVWHGAGRYDPGKSSVLGWIAMIAHRRAVDRVRSLTRSRAREQHWASPSIAVDSVWLEMASSADSDLVTRALPSLSIIQRQAVTMMYLEHHTAAEIAAILVVPVGTVKTRVRDGLRKLRTVLVQLDFNRPA